MKHRSSRTRCAPPPVGVPARGWGGRTLLVAVRRDAAGRELLTWALAKAAAAGDRVVALHVTTAGAADGFGPDERSRAADSLASVLGAYDGFCNLNEISLELRVCHGSSVKRALVNEAVSYGAAQLILGITKNSRHLGLSATVVAKYCAKRIPQSCTVLAVSNGAVVYHGNAIQEEINHCCTTMSPRRNYSLVAETPRRIYRKILDAAATIGEKTKDDSSIGHRRSLQRNMSMSMSAPVSPKVAAAPPTPVTCHRRELPEVAAGWPLRRKDIMPASPECSEMSVVEWAMRLPSRCSLLSPASSVKTSDYQATSQSKSDLTEPPYPVTEEAAELVSIRDKYSSMYTMFSYGDLARITSDFSPERVVGKGGASHVYNGRGEDGKELAVKVLKSSAEVMKEFSAEIGIISSVHHKNAMALVGFCAERGKLMLVYDYMRRGSLEEILHGEKECKGSRLDWPERFKVAVGIARALNYLHGGGHTKRPVVHRDVKSSNILISQDCEPKLCDFGLALWAADAAAQVTGDDLAGTFGYLAPEYFMHGKVSDKMDVYAFGVVLLELVSGRKPVSSGGPKGQESIVMWANSAVQGGKLTELVDPSLPTDGDNAGEMERMALAAALCIRRAPQGRPSMANVLKLLDGDSDAVQWARSQLGVPNACDDNHGDEDYYSAAASPDKNDIQSYIKLALLDGGDEEDDDDSASMGCAVDFIAGNMSLEEYMKGRWSRSSSLTEDGGSNHGGSARIFV
ncbi:probable receptor-like serine/threonine-protein kinase At5g57670 [Triticum dicoccoides]|uniref:probable receptor-like serine/threonine-protein kinase At5g57670 n=1 Tax=Triticum dicoccoides TaxID=85692 RepID=UPI00188FAC5B|nr:probable receptor-like serine/threonine-protein kinase At5g57670 [Triticum dicoccoides]